MDGEILLISASVSRLSHVFIKGVVRRHKPCFYGLSPQGSRVTSFARSLSRNTTAQAVVAARLDAGLMVNVIAILIVLLALLAGAAWTHVT